MAFVRTFAAIAAVFLLSGAAFADPIRVVDDRLGARKVIAQDLDGYFWRTAIEFIRPVCDRLIRDQGPVRTMFLEAVAEGIGDLADYVQGRGVEDIRPIRDDNTVMSDYSNGGAGNQWGRFHSYLTYEASGSASETWSALEFVFDVRTETFCPDEACNAPLWEVKVWLVGARKVLRARGEGEGEVFPRYSAPLFFAPPTDW